MATKTSNYEFNKPEQNDFYDVDVQNENWDKVDEELSEFDDSGVTEDIKSFPDFLSKFVTGNKVAITLRNLKAGLQFVLHAGQIVNNCVTDNTGLPLSAAQGKVLKDLIDTTNNNLSNANSQITQLYSDIGKTFTATGSAAAVYNSYVTTATIELPAGHTYLVIGFNQVDRSISDSIISADLVGNQKVSFQLARTTSQSGGGCYAVGVVQTTNAKETIILRGYGYDTGTYYYQGKICAIQLV